MTFVNIDALVGLTMQSIEGMVRNSESIVFRSLCGRVFKMTHLQDCCESVYLEDVVGEPADLVGSPVVAATESSSKSNSLDGSETWTFYSLRTNKGTVTLRWVGESNGYYSEEVDFLEMPLTA